MKHNFTLISLAVATASLSADAAYNVYSRNGLRLDIQGGIYAHFEEKSKRLSYRYPRDNYRYNAERQRWENVAQTGYDEEQQDRRMRLGYNNNASYLVLRGTQQIDQEYIATGTFQISYDNANYLYLSQASVALERQNWGSVSFGKQWLHTGAVPRTNTYYPINGYGNSALRFDFTRVENLHLSAYYLFPSSADVRRISNYEKISGSGFSGTYLFKLGAEHSLLAGLAHSKDKTNASDFFAKRNYGTVGSLEYKYRQLTLATDYGVEKEKYLSQEIDQAKTRYIGARIKYEFTPKFMMAVGYGSARTKRSDVNNLGTVFNTQIGYLPYNETLRFDLTKRTMKYLEARYEILDNLAIYAKIKQEKTKNYVQSTLFSQRKNKEISGGIRFEF